MFYHINYKCPNCNHSWHRQRELPENAICPECDLPEIEPFSSHRLEDGDEDLLHLLKRLIEDGEIRFKTQATSDLVQHALDHTNRHVEISPADMLDPSDEPGTIEGLPIIGAATFMISVYLLGDNEDDQEFSKARVIVSNPRDEAGEDAPIPFWLCMTEYLMSLTASKCDLGYEKTMEMLVDAAMQYKTIHRPPSSPPQSPAE